MQVTTQQNDTLDLLCWRHLGAASGVVEQTLKLNPGIADHGTILPTGITVTLPQQAARVSTKKMINLWD